MPVTTDVPTRADGLQLIGEMAGSGYRTPPSLVRRADGQTLQLTPLLYALVSAVDGRRGPEEIAERVRAATGQPVSADNVTTLIEQHLRPLGVLTKPDGTQPELKKSNPLLGLNWKFAVTDPERTRRITAPFQVLFSPLLWIPITMAFLVITWWVLLDKGLASATYDAFARPSMLVLIFGLTILSGGFHEFGHAAAARRGGATPGVMGGGIYLVWPAFYTDVTDSYRLGRLGRVRTDLGGLYFNAIVAVVVFATWAVTQWDGWLLVVAAQILQMLRQLTPLVRFDGYHILADLTGVPDLFHRIKPTLLSLWPSRWRSPEAGILKPWARAVITLWVLIVVPLLLGTLLVMVLAFPRVAGTAWASAERELNGANAAWSAGQHLDAVGSYLAIVAVIFPVLATILVLLRFGRRTVTGAWRGTAGRPIRRAGACLLIAAMVAGLVWAWWPTTPKYRPIQPWEEGTLTQAVSAVPGVGGTTAPARPAFTGAFEAGGGELGTAWPEDKPLPTADQPQLVLVLVPAGAPGDTGDQDDPAAGGHPATDPGTESPTWVFPFDQPDPPAPGDTQAMAVNTTDNSVVYDVALAMVWADGQEDVDNINSANAFASCSDCVTVAISFQVVLVVGQADVVIPQNISQAVNWDCFRCITAALASQLVITLDDAPGEAELVALSDIWSDLAEFATTIYGQPISAIEAQLEEFKSEILAILGEAPPATETGTATDGSGTAPSPAPSDGASATPDGSTSSSDESSTETQEPAPEESSEPAPTSEAPDPSTTPAPEPTPAETSQPSP